MSDDNIFNDLTTSKDNPLEISLADSLKLLVESLIDDKNTNLSKRELKAISICFRNKYIRYILVDYVPNKRYVNAFFEKSLQKAIGLTSNAIGQMNTNQQENDSFLSRFWKRR